MQSMPMMQRLTESMPGRHVFIVVGNKTIFLCHQIMSHMEGHNAELVLEVELDDETLKFLFEDRKKGVTHFLANSKFNLFALEQIVCNRVLFGSIGSCFLGFQADIWNTFTKDPKKPNLPPWLDKDIKPVLSDVPVKIVRVVHYRHYNENLGSRIHEQYTLFGKDEEAHLYHSVSRRPDYDHVCSLVKAPDWLNPYQLESSVQVSFPGLAWSSHSTYCQNPLPDGTKHKVLYYGLDHYCMHPEPQNTGHSCENTPEARKDISDLFVDVDRVWWYSTRIVNYFNDNPCGGGHDNEIP